VTSATPTFLSGVPCAPADGWARPGQGVLDPATPAAIRLGAEDGGEIGAYHDDAYGLEDVALAEQAADHLPYSLEPVLVADPRLLRVPPTLTTTGEER
jgi:hypothetical protein